jgi:hypothetical protein
MNCPRRPKKAQRVSEEVGGQRRKLEEKNWRRKTRGEPAHFKRAAHDTTTPSIHLTFSSRESLDIQGKGGLRSSGNPKISARKLKSTSKTGVLWAVLQQSRAGWRMCKH